jgi:hypothetical protein
MWRGLSCPFKWFGEFAALGCSFVTGAVEVLERLDKGRTGAGVEAALDILDAAGIAIQPTLVAFTPWTTPEDHLAVAEFIERRGLWESISPIQVSIRLVLPPGSLLVESPDAGEWIGELDAANFTCGWPHPDARRDKLRAVVPAIQTTAPRAGWCHTGFVERSQREVRLTTFSARTNNRV